jgi:paraquat-inducible protein B
MSQKPNPRTIGLFVVMALMIAIAAILLLGSSKLFEQADYYVLYFDGDLSGLDVGAPVTTHGVKIGEVTRIALVYDYADHTLSAPVIIRVSHDVFRHVNEQNHEPDEATMQLHIERGLRARLETLSIVTGKLRISLDHHPETVALYRGTTSGLPEIPTLPTTLQHVAQKLANLPLESIITDIHRSVRSLTSFLESGKMADTVDELNQTLVEVNATLRSGEMQSVVLSLDQTLSEMQNLLQQINQPAGPFRRELTEALQQITEASRSIRHLTDYLNRHPDALIRGKGDTP